MLSTNCSVESFFNKIYIVEYFDHTNALLQFCGANWIPLQLSSWTTYISHLLECSWVAKYRKTITCAYLSFPFSFYLHNFKSIRSGLKAKILLRFLWKTLFPFLININYLHLKSLWRNSSDFDSAQRLWTNSLYVTFHMLQDKWTYWHLCEQ